jgi:hypothetical protein
MPLSKAIELALAKRQLRRIEEDRPAFLLRLKVANATPEVIQKMTEWFDGIQARARSRVRDLEKEIKSGAQI